MDRQTVTEYVERILDEHAAQHPIALPMAFACACGASGVIDANEIESLREHLHGLLAEAAVRREEQHP